MASVAVFERWKPAAFILEQMNGLEGNREGDGDKGQVTILAEVAMGVGPESFKTARGQWRTAAVSDKEQRSIVIIIIMRSQQTTFKGIRSTALILSGL